MEGEPFRGTVAPSAKGEQTMQQLLAAAENLFAERGFRGASIRDIAAEAGSNIAAVNYHFGSKENLYREVFRHHMAGLRNRGVRAVRELLQTGSTKPTVEAVLSAFAQAAGVPEGRTETRRFALLLSQELVEPQLPPGFLRREALEPVERALDEALSAACPGLDPKTLSLCIHSFLGQLMHLHKIQVYFGARETEGIPMADSEEAIRHIVRFTSAGIRALQEQGP